MDTSHAAESFRGLLLRHRGRAGLTQRDLATRAGVSMRSVQDWESSVSYPTAGRLQALIRVLLEAGGLTAGEEAAEARELWAAAEREACGCNRRSDEEWFAGCSPPRRPIASGESATVGSYRERNPGR
jgi:transcriptional regulator with XRE-family HTH domain